MKQDTTEREGGGRSGSVRLWLALIPALSVPFLASLFYFVVFSEHLLARVLYGGAKVFLVVWPLVALWVLLREPFRWADLWPRGSGRFLWVGLASGAAILVLMWVLQHGEVGRMVAASVPAIRAKADSLGVLRHYWAFGLFLALLHSFLEEYYWRWFVYGRLRRGMPQGWAHFLAGTCFAAHHVVIATQYFPAGWGWVLGGLTGVGGVLWSWMYEKQGSLAGPWLSHVLADLGILALGHQALFGTWW